MKSFKSIQFNDVSAPTKDPIMFSHSRKLYPELASFLDMQIKQEKLLKLERENNPRF